MQASVWEATLNLNQMNRHEWSWLSDERNEDGEPQYVPYGPIISAEIEAAKHRGEHYYQLCGGRQLNLAQMRQEVIEDPDRRWRRVRREPVRRPSRHQESEDDHLTRELSREMSGMSVEMSESPYEELERLNSANAVLDSADPSNLQPPVPPCEEPQPALSFGTRSTFASLPSVGSLPSWGSLLPSGYTGVDPGMEVNVPHPPAAPPPVTDRPAAPRMEAADVKTLLTTVRSSDKDRCPWTHKPRGCGAWLCGSLVAIAVRHPELIQYEDTATATEVTVKPKGGKPTKRMVDPGARKFTIAYRNDSGRGGKNSNDNLHEITRLVRQILEAFGSNLKVAEWNAVRRHLTPDFWAATCMGGATGGDHRTQFVELCPGMFQRCYEAMLCYVCEAKRGSGRSDCSGRDVLDTLGLMPEVDGMDGQTVIMPPPPGDAAWPAFAPVDDATCEPVVSIVESVHVD